MKLLLLRYLVILLTICKNTKKSYSKTGAPNRIINPWAKIQEKPKFHTDFQSSRALKDNNDDIFYYKD
jgi:hypothetical protein